MSEPDLYQRALDHYHARRFADCETLLRARLEEHPDDVQSLSLLGGVRLSTEGPTAAAEALMRRAAELAPDNANLLNNLGAVCFARRLHDEALACFERATVVDAGHVDAWNNRGKTLRALGRLSEAEAACRRALELDGSRAQVVNDLAVLMNAQGRTNEAIDLLSRFAEQGRADADTYGTLGLLLSLRKEYPQAIASYEKAVALNPRKAEYHVNLGQIHIETRELDKAKADCRRAIILDPDSVGAYNNLGVVLRDTGEHDQAVAAFRVARERSPGASGILVNLGIALHEMRRYDEACEAFEAALAIEPRWGLVQVNLANAYLKSDRPETALAAYDKALEFLDDAGPYLTTITAGRGYACVDLGRWEEALTHFDAVIKEQPDHALVRFGRAVVLLRLGRLKEGWREYEWRFPAANFAGVTHVDWMRPVWDGRPFEGKTLLVHHEQGLGDAIHFVRYLPRVKELGGRIVLRCGPPLFRLFESMPAIDRMVSRRDESKPRRLEYDLQVPLATLPSIFGTELDSIPADVPYLAVDDSLVSRWAARVPRDRFNVGLVWEGNRDQGENKMRSCTLNDFAPLARVPGVRFYSLQVGPASEQARTPPEGMDLVDLTGELYDMAETAALLKNLDLVVTIDTSVAHLAGALGHDVWTVLWTYGCWRYLLERRDSPWYPNMRLFRQRVRGDWSTVFNEVADELQRVVFEKRDSGRDGWSGEAKAEQAAVAVEMERTRIR